MRIVFDAFWWDAGPPSLRHVLREMISAWSSAFPEDEFLLLVRRGHTAQDTPPGSRVVETRVWPQAVVAASIARRVALKNRADVVFSQNFAPRPASSLVSAIYLHDVLFLTNPEWFTPTERAYFSLMRRFASRADIVFTSSRSEAARIRLHTRARAVEAVGLGISTELLGRREVRPNGIDVEDGDFLLTVGRLNARKNLSAVIEAAVASGAVSRAKPLIVVGEPDGRAAALSDEAGRAVESGLVVFLGFVDEEELVWLYSHCALFVYLSRGEGFGMPPVEARHFGARVLVSDLPVFHETLGDEAAFVSLDDPAEQAAAIARLIAEGSRGTPTAIHHDWHDAVERMRTSLADRVAARTSTGQRR